MATVLDIYRALDFIAPFSLTMDFDNTGILVGNQNQHVSKALLALDCTTAILDQAIAVGTQLIITHHPLIFHPLKRLNEDSLVYRLVRENIALISAHTNLDIAQGGVNDVLAKVLGLSNVEGLEQISQDPNPKAYLGRVGQLEQTYSPTEFAKYVKSAINCEAVRYTQGRSSINRVAVCSGSGGSYLKAALAANADALVTGEVHHDQFIEAAQAGICLVDAGHFNTEDIVLEPLREHLSEKIIDVEFLVSHISAISTL